MQLIASRLDRRTATAGPDPLLTYYDLGSGERTELSAVTTGNWVAKSCHLLTDEYGLEPGETVALVLARTHPGHWVTACLELACWQLGLTVTVDAGPDTRLVVTGPDDLAAVAGSVGRRTEVLACSLHPLGLPFTVPLPRGVADYTADVRAQPDRYVPAPLEPGLPAWRSDEAELSQDELAGLPGTAGRRLVRPTTPWATARDGVVAALLGGGSAVVVAGPDSDAVDRIRVTEQVTEG